VKTVKVGVIGLAWPGNEHLKGYVACPHSEIVALCDIDTELLARQAKEYSVSKTFTNYRKMLALRELDAISICVPNDLHMPMAVDALAAGKHVLCEKPPALSPRQAREMADAAKKAKRVLMYALVQRFGPEARVLRKFIDGGQLGDLYFGRTAYLRRRGIPLGKEGWFINKKRSGGGSLIDIGVHCLDRAWWLMGNPKPVAIVGSTYAYFGHTVPKKYPYTVEDASFGFVKFANGASLIVEATWAYNLPPKAYTELAGTKGGASLDPLTIYTEREGVICDITPQVPRGNGFHGETAHFVDCILKNRKPISHPEQGIQLMQMLDGIYRSSQTGKEVRID
jgi:predicted dehydrogenase